jgi:heme exporter protein B
VNVPGTGQFCGRLLRRQLILAVRRPIEIGNPLLFFAIVIALFPLGLGPGPDKLVGFAPGVLWITALLSNLLTSDSVFRSDYDDGSLEQLLLAPQPLFLSVLACIGAHWLTTGLLLAVVSPVFALMLNLSLGALGTLVASLLLGTAVLSLLGGIGAALTVGLKRGGMLISLLILPLYIPVLIFGSAAVQAAISGQPAGPYLAILGALLSLAIALAPLAIAAGLRISIDA